jgi:hypothetical protein
MILPKTKRSHARSAAQRRSAFADHAAFTVWILAYVAVLGIVFAPKGTFITTGTESSASARMIGTTP